MVLTCNAILTCILAALGGVDASAYQTKVEDWSNVNRATFPSTQSVNGIEKQALETDLKYSQVLTQHPSRLAFRTLNDVFLCSRR